jgi:FkbM family methyltransferase
VLSTSENNSFATEPLRSKAIRKIVRSYKFARGKDRLFLTLNSLFRLPQKLTIDLLPETSIDLDLSDYLQRWIYCHHLSDESDYFMLGSVLRTGETFVDIGANIGIVSMIAARSVGPDGVVFAVEALPETRSRLQANLDRNQLNNVIVLPFALIDENKTLDFFASADGNIGGSGLAATSEKARCVKVEGVKMDWLLEQGSVTGCDVLKMDIEGAEFMALRGMETFFNKFSPRAVMIEISEHLLARFSNKPSDIIDFFSGLGYKWYRANSRRFEKLEDLEIKGHNNLWAIKPNGVDEHFLA